MKQFRVTVEFEDVVAIVNAEDIEEAEEKYWQGDVVEWEAEAEQPYLKVEEIDD